MASITIIPANLRGIAARIEGKLRERPGPAELQARAGYAARLFDKTEGQQAEHFRYLQAEAPKVLRSVPVLEYVQQTRDLTQLVTSRPARSWEMVRVSRGCTGRARRTSPALRRCPARSSTVRTASSAALPPMPSPAKPRSAYTTA